MFTKDDYEKLHSLVFRPDYPGYKPTVQEIPNGNGKVDRDKRYAHVAPKYFETNEQKDALGPFLERAHNEALTIARLLGLPEQYMPNIAYGALRVLDYPPGSISNLHEDFDLFTLMMYRDQPECFRSFEEDVPALVQIRKINPQAHIGQLGTEVGLGAATPHEVLASDTAQHSIVYFSIPDHASILPSGVNVRDWLNERMARSRTSFKKYE